MWLQSLLGRRGGSGCSTQNSDLTTAWCPASSLQGPFDQYAWKCPGRVYIHTSLARSRVLVGRRCLWARWRRVRCCWRRLFLCRLAQWAIERVIRGLLRSWQGTGRGCPLGCFSQLLDISTPARPVSARRRYVVEVSAFSRNRVELPLAVVDKDTFCASAGAVPARRTARTLDFTVPTGGAAAMVSASTTSHAMEVHLRMRRALHAVVSRSWHDPGERLVSDASKRVTAGHVRPATPSPAPPRDDERGRRNNPRPLGA